MNEMLILGWREWVELPQLGVQQIKAKIDTGARTSALHAFNLKPLERNHQGKQQIQFDIQPHQRDALTILTCIADVVDKRTITDSGGHREERWVISTLFKLGSHSWPIDVTLTARDDMKFRMLLGRHALRERAMVNPSCSYLIGKKHRKLHSNDESE